jgi:6-phosphogluconolactonase/glucosamine-6-phosphate isomerase/deaminase
MHDSLNAVVLSDILFNAGDIAWAEIHLVGQYGLKTTYQVIDCNHTMAGRYQLGTHNTTDITGTAGNKNLHTTILPPSGMMHGMRYQAVTSVAAAGHLIAQAVAAALSREPVVWLLSGGSAIGPQVAAAKKLESLNLPLEHLTITLIDERYGQPGHADSNWRQLESQGFKVPGARLLPVLSTDQPPGAVAQRWWYQLESLLQTSQSLGILGIGPDYHIAGIKPDSPATHTDEPVCAYNWPDYRRITLTAQGLSRLDRLLVYACGAAKWPVLEHLDSSQVSVAAEPSQWLKNFANVTILTDKPERLT